MPPVWHTLRTNLLANGTLSQGEAGDFFESLFEDTTQKCKALSPKFVDQFPTRQYSGPGGYDERPSGWLQGEPFGVCDHFTAGESVESTLKWFSSYDQWKITKNGQTVRKYAGASAEFVIGIDGTPYLLIPFWEGKSAWHEPSLNKRCIGIEHVNVGPVKQVGDSFNWWYRNWTAPFRFAASFPPVQQDPPWRGANWMVPYSRQQLITNLLIKRALLCFYPYGKMKPSFFIGHSDFRDDKKDPGPLFPLAQLRQLAFETAPINGYDFFNSYTPVDKAYLDSFDSMDMSAIVQDASDADALPTDLEFDSQVDKVTWVQLNLRKLGYKTPISGAVSNSYINAVEKFQGDYALEVDGIAGPNTRAKIQELTS